MTPDTPEEMAKLRANADKMASIITADHPLHAGMAHALHMQHNFEDPEPRSRTTERRFRKLLKWIEAKEPARLADVDCRLSGLILRLGHNVPADGRRNAKSAIFKDHLTFFSSWLMKTAVPEPVRDFYEMFLPGAEVTIKDRFNRLAAWLDHHPKAGRERWRKEALWNVEQMGPAWETIDADDEKDYEELFGLLFFALFRCPPPTV